MSCYFSSLRRRGIPGKRGIGPKRWIIGGHFAGSYARRYLKLLSIKIPPTGHGRSQEQATPVHRGDHAESGEEFEDDTHTREEVKETKR